MTWTEQQTSTTAGSGAHIASAQGASLASASTITPTDTYHVVTGSTQINTIATTQMVANSLLVLTFSSAITLGSSGNIIGGGALDAGTTVAFWFDGTSFRVLHRPVVAQLYNVKDYGATGDGTTDDYTAIAAAITAASNAGGGIVFFPDGIYAYGTTLSLNSTNYITLRGTAGVGSSTYTGSVLKYTGTGGGNAITASNSTGAHLERIQIYASAGASFTGKLINFDSSTMAAITECNVGQATITSYVLVSLDDAQVVKIDRTHFVGGSVQVRGLGSLTFSNQVAITNSDFNGYLTAAISNPIEAWLIAACTFEPSTGNNTVVLARSAGACKGLVFTGNWVGDQTAASTLISISGSSVSITGNYFGSSSGATTLVSLAGASTAITITGNYIDRYINTILDCNSLTANSIIIRANQCYENLTILANTSGLAGADTTGNNVNGGIGYTVAAGINSTPGVVTNASQPCARAYLDSAAQAIPNNTFTAVTLNAESFDRGTLHDNSTNNTRITIAAANAGVWALSGQVMFAGSAAGNLRAVRIRKNGTTTIAQTQVDTTTTETGIFVLGITGFDVAAANDYYELEAYQLTGGSLNITNGEANTWLAAFKLA